MASEILKKLISKEPLSSRDIKTFVSSLVNNEVPDSVIGAFIIGLTQKGVNLDEIKSLVTAMREQALKLDFYNGDVVDSCGTGADLQSTFNISTTSAIVAAAAGCKVIKQTNSNITSLSGSSNFIEALNINLCKTHTEAKEQFEQNGICFVHSPSFNRAANVLNPIRRELGFRSVFNFMGPIINPSFPNCQLLGVAFPEMAQNLIEVLKFLNLKQAMVVNAKEPLLDEISICSATTVYELKDGEIETYEITPEKFGIKRADVSSLRGATPQYNANLSLEIFNGKIKDSKLDVVAMNAGAMIYLAGGAKNHLEGIMKAYSIISKGLASEKIQSLQKHSLCLKQLI